MSQKPETQTHIMRSDRFLSRLVAMASAVAALALAPLSQAQVSNYWNSTTSGDLFTTAANWVDAFTLGNPGAVPTGNDIAVFSSSALGVDTNAGPRITNAVIIDADVAFGRLLITSNGLATGIEPTAYRFGGTGTITLNGDGTGSLVGQEVITIQLGNNAHNPTISNNINIALAAGRINVAGGRTLTLSGNVGGAGSQLTTTNTGTLRLTGSNLFSGIRTRAGGTVDVNAQAGLGIAPGAFTADAIALWNGSTLTLRTNATATGGGLDGGNYTINSNIGITVGHTAAGAATINVNNGTVSILSDDQIRGFAGTTVGTNRLAKAGAGTLVLGGSQSLLNRHRIIAGTLQVNSDASLGTAPAIPVHDAIQITNGTLALNFTGELNANRGIAIGFTNNTGPVTWNAELSVLGATNVVTYNGIISNAWVHGGLAEVPGRVGNLIKDGPGTLNLAGGSGQHKYSGITRIDAGYLTENSVANLPSTSEIHFNGGGLRVGSDYTYTDLTIPIGSNNNSRAVFFVESGATLTVPGVFANNHTNPSAANNIISKNGPGTMILGGNLNHFGGVESSNGVLVLSGVNTYNGISQTLNANARISISSLSNLGTNLFVMNNGGILATEDITFGLTDQLFRLGNSNNANSGVFEVASGKTLTINSVIFQNHTNGVSAGGITKEGAGTLVLGNTNFFAGTTTVRDGTLSVTINEALGALSEGYNVLLATNLSGKVAGVGTNFTISKGSFILNGTTQTVRDVNFTDNNAASTASSTATISGGDLMVQGNINYTGGPTNLLGQRETGASLLSANLQLMNNNKTVTVNDSINTAEELTISGTITGYADDDVTTGLRTLTKAGLGTLVLSSPVGANSFSNTTINAGTIKLGANEQLPNARTLTVQGQALGGEAVAGIFDINGKNETIGALTIGGGTVALVNDFANAMIIDSAGGGLLTLGGTLTYQAGTATNNQGMATISANLDLGAANRTANIQNSSVAAVDLNITGNVSGTGRTLTVTNTGTLRFGGANTYSSLVVSNGGNVLNDGTHSGAATVGPGGTLGGSGSIAGAVSVLAGGTLAPGSSPGTMTVGDLNLAAGVTLSYELDVAGTVGSGVNDLIIVNGNLTLDGSLNITGLANFAGGVYRLINYTGTLADNGLDIGLLSGTASGFAPGDLSIDTSVLGQVNLIVIPEPSTMALAGIGAALLGLHVIRRRRNR
jgi:fibronectin-binding autotransporter adhesin